MDGRLLLVSMDRKSREVLPAALRAGGPSLAVDVAARAADALACLEEACDVVVCCVDSVDELSLVIRVRKRHPDVPLVVLSRVGQPGFETLARARGADAVVRERGGPAETAEGLVLAATTARLARQNRAILERSRSLVQDLRRLVAQNRELVGTALGLTSADQEEFAVLHVEDDPLQASLVGRLLARAKLPPFRRCVATVDEATAYLSGRGRYADRSLHPFPSMILSDLKLRGESGLDLLRWTRRCPATRTLGFVMLSASDDERDIEAAYALGADLYLVKSHALDDVVSVVRSVYLRYMEEKVTGCGSGPSSGPAPV